MFPGIDIQFQNGQLGQTVEVPDGVFGLLASGVAIGVTFLLDTPYQIKGMADVAALGITPNVDNYVLYKTLKEFYAEAGEGTELWLMVFARTKKVSDWFKPEVATGKAPAQKLLDAANGKLKMLFTAFSPTVDYVLELENGVDKDVWEAISQAQTLAENYTAKKYATYYTLIEGYAFSGDKVEIDDLTEKSFNRCAVLIGDTEKRTVVPASKGAATGVVAGRLAKIQVHVNPGRVRDGALSNLTAYILDVPAELFDTEALHDKGYITFRQHTGKSGYFLSDDPMACEVEDDYHYGTARRVIDKAYRLAYTALLEFLLDNSILNGDGTISAISAKNIENAVETLIFQQMTANGELSANPQDSKDRGVICRVDLTNNVTSTSRIKLSMLQVKITGVNRWIDVPLGFVPVTSN